MRFVALTQREAGGAVPSERSAAPPPIAAGLLIGGASRRMGSAKAWLDWNGESFAERIARHLGAVASEVYLLGDCGTPPRAIAHLPRVADLEGVGGPLAGMLAAFAARPEAAWLFASCDQPLVTEATLRWLLAERQSGRTVLLPALSTSRLDPFPGLYEPASRAALEALLSPAGRASLQGLRAVPEVVRLAVPAELLPTLRGANTPLELAALRRDA